MKIIYSAGYPAKLAPLVQAEIEEWTNAGYDITLINHRQELGIEREWLPQELNEIYYMKDRRLFKLYNKISDLAQAHDVFIVAENVYYPEFVKSLNNIYTVLVSGDDPESSDHCSKPYVRAFDHSFCLGGNFDKDTKVTEKFLEWGAKRADWWPHGVRPGDYDASLTEEDIYNKERDIDLVYVGTCWLKLDRLAEIKKAFPQMKVYGRGWNWKAFIASPRSYRKMYGHWEWRTFSGALKALLLGLWRVKELPGDELVPLYQRCKIGLNIHLSFGPINRRMYQLPANGVMQVCDCPEGLGQVFKIGKEVIVYHSIEEAIELIRYYLEHDDERKKIAAAGFKRTMKDYKRLNTFCQAMDKIKKGMLEDGIEYFRDGTPIRCEH